MTITDIIAHGAIYRLYNELMSDQYSAKANKLLLDALEQDRPAFVTVQSNSMTPLFRAGDQLQIASLNALSPEPGDVIVFGELGDWVAHRYWGVRTLNDRAFLLTRGDRLPYFDRFVAADQVKAVIVARRRSGRLLPIDRGVGAMLNRCLWFLLRLEAQVMRIPTPTTESEPGIIAVQGLWGRLVRRLFYTVMSVLTFLVSLVSN